MPEKSKRDADVKRMADLLRAGATMLSEICPDDKVPIFKLTTGELICPVCNRKVILVKSAEAEAEAERSTAESAVSSELEDVLMTKITDLKEKMARSEDPAEIEKFSRALVSLYEAVSKVRRSKV